MSSLVNNVRSIVSVLTAAGLLALAGCAGAGNKDCCSTDAKTGAKTDTKAEVTDIKSAAPARNAQGRIIVVNTVCPIGGDDFETNDRPDVLTRTYNGQSIGFCCDHCVAKFDKMDDAGKAAVLKAAAANKTM